MEEGKEKSSHVESTPGNLADMNNSFYEREDPFLVLLFFSWLRSDMRSTAAESRLSKYIPGGYSPSRCHKLRNRPMMYAVLALAGCSIMFFGYGASVMSQVNTNANYLQLMGADSGSNRDAAAVGGLVSVWYGGFAIGRLCAFRGAAACK